VLLVTGNSDFAADGGEISGWCPPHWCKPRKDPCRPPGWASERDRERNCRAFGGLCVRNLQDTGLPLVEFGQGFLSMGPASAEFLRLLIGELRHGGNPIATWCASNVSVRKDPAGNEKPDKERSTEKIDAIVAAIQAGGDGGRSVYETRGLLVI
jgi:Phage Terminase